ncbi:MAG TPA: ABC transporter substrate-binding protein [Methylomirabilota bacterium]|nr:ABC transporter substrate-binding protein [Methylomirabilota bacterium]
MTKTGWTRRQVLRAGAAGFGMAVTAGGPRPVAAQGAGTLRIGVGALPATLDPHKNTAGISMATYFQLYNGLTRIDEAGQLQPGLAESWRWVNDRVFQLRLRKGVTFHNGEPLDAAVVKWNIERIVNPETKSPVKDRIPTVTGAEVADGLTVNLVNSGPSGLLPRALAVVFPIPPGYYQAKGANEFVRQPVGTGPFRYLSGTPGDNQTLEAFPGYWEGAAKLRQVFMRVMKEDGARVAALEAGDVDMIQNVPPDQVKRLQGAGYQVAWELMARQHFCIANSVLEGGGPFKDPRVRQALNYAVDKDAILSRIFFGYGKLAEGQFVDERAVGYNRALKRFPYDPRKARELLAAAGFAGGTPPITFWASQGAYLKDKETIEAIAGYLADVGINVQINQMEWAKLTEIYYSSKMVGLNLQGWNYFPVMDADFIITHYKSSNKPPWYASERFDEVYRKSTVTTDPAARQQLLAEAQRILHEDPPGLYLLHPPDMFATSRKVQGFKPRWDATIPLFGVTKSA